MFPLHKGLGGYQFPYYSRLYHSRYLVRLSICANIVGFTRQSVDFKSREHRATGMAVGWGISDELYDLVSGAKSIIADCFGSTLPVRPILVSNSDRKVGYRPEHDIPGAPEKVSDAAIVAIP